jgi:hypothetical protein
MAADIRTRIEGFGLGWWVALFVALIAIILGFMGLLPKEVAMLIVAVCAVRL